MNGQSGFTLLEFLIAMTLMGLVLVIAYGGLRLGMRSWDAGEQRAAELNEIRLVQEFLRRQFKQSMSVSRYDEREGQVIVFTGESDSLTMVAPMLAHLGLAGLYLIQLDVVEAEKGDQLRISWRPYHPDEPANAWDEEDTETTMLLEGVSEVSWEYFGADQPDREPTWHEQWLAKLQRPQLVRLNLEWQGEPWPPLVAALPN